jgi:FkbM family methyltransferase
MPFPYVPMKVNLNMKSEMQTPSISHAFKRAIFLRGPVSLTGQALRLVRRIYNGDRRDVLTPLRYGGIMLVNRFETTNVFPWAFGIWEPGITAMIRGQIKPGYVFVDIGAHIGYFSILAARAGAISVSIEPSPKLLPRLRRNLELNSVEGEVLGIAISDQKGSAILFGGQEANTGKASLLEDWTENSESFEVEVDTLDRLDAHFDRIGTVKIDVEGVEQLILEQILDRLHRMPALDTLVFELHPEQFKSCRNVLDAFIARGFFLFAIENDYSARFYRRTSFKVHTVDLENAGSHIGTDFVLSKKDSDSFAPKGVVKLPALPENS